MSCINQAVATINSEIETVNSEPNSATRQIKLDLLEKIKARIEYTGQPTEHISYPHSSWMDR